MLDRLIEGWQATHFARVLAVEHARGHALPAGAFSRAYDDSVVTIYRALNALAADPRLYPMSPDSKGRK
jgi:hypothetical protein